MILYTHNWRPQKQKYLTYENLDLSLLRNLNNLDSPLDKDYNYHEAFKNLDVNALRKDIAQMLTTSQEWWPADYGNYGPFFIRYSWHAAGTYRVFDGRGGNNRGQQRFSPVGSWPDNANIDKGKQLLWPIKQKYGNAVSWSDLIALVGNVALDIMGLKTIGFAFGRLDDWQGDNTIWGYDYVEMSSNVKNGQLQAPFSSTQMGLIYVNPEGPDGKPDRVGSVKNIRDTFSGMGMNDRETVVLIAGGHTFGKTHGAGPKNHVGPAPDKALLEQQGKGWASSFRTGKGNDTITSGPQVIWTSTPTKWSHDYLKNLYELQWKKSLSPAQAHQWSPTNVTEQRMVPDPFNPGLKRLPQMLTTDLALKQDQSYNNNATDFYKDPVAFAKQFAEAWFKLMHRDMGPKSRYMGPLAPQQDFIWQDPVPEPKGQQISQNEIKQIKQLIKNSGLTNKQMIRTAWASASTYRKTDYRGGANGARIALLPQCEWQINEPQKLAKVLQCYKKIQSQFNKSHQSPQLSLADLIILAGNLSIQSSSTEIPLQISFTPGRTDASQAQTDIQSFNYLKCKSDGFINYHDGTHADSFLPQALVQKASMLNLNVPEMAVLFAGLRALGIVHGDGQDGILTKSVGKLDNQFFVNLLDNSTEWKKIGENKYSGVDRKTGEERWTATAFDLIFGYNPELKAVSQHYAERTSLPKFVKDFGNAWNKVMMLGRFDVVKL